MGSKIEEKLKKIMSKTFNCNLSELTNKTTIHQLKQWDSISHYLLISNLEKEFKIKFLSGEPETMVSLKIISATIASHGKKN
jgi:acyl carrier protein